MDTRERKIYRVTVLGSVINVLLVALKFAFGIMGRSSAMIADAVHSLSDLITDVVVIVFVKLSNKPQDSDHDYGHGKYETLATAFIGLALLAVGVMILYGGAEKIVAALRGEVLPQPGMIALWAALISVVSKEWCYPVTGRRGQRMASPQRRFLVDRYGPRHRRCDILRRTLDRARSYRGRSGERLHREDGCCVNEAGVRRAA